MTIDRDFISLKTYGDLGNWNRWVKSSNYPDRTDEKFRYQGLVFLDKHNVYNSNLLTFLYQTRLSGFVFRLKTQTLQKIMSTLSTSSLELKLRGIEV